MNLEKILRIIIITGLFSIPFVVLYVATSMFFPFVVGKNFAFRVIVEIIFVAWLLLSAIKAEYRPYKSIILVSVAVFIGIVALADIFGENPFKSILSNFERMEGLITLLHLFAYFVVWATVLNTEKLRIWFWRVSLGVSVIVSSHALMQFLTTEKNRLDSTLGNPIYLAVYLLFHIFVAVILAVRRGVISVERFMLGGIVLFELSILYLTATRGATIGLIGGMLLATVGIAITEQKDLFKKKIAASIVLLVFILISGFLAMRNTEFVQNNHVLKRFAHISLSEGTVMARTYVWNIALKGVKEKPILGWGQENFNYVFDKYYDPRMYNQEQWFDRTHNIVFDWLIAAGILGLLSYVSIFLALMFSLYQTDKFNVEQKWFMVGLFVAYGFHNLTVFDNIISYILFFSIIAWLYAIFREDSNPIITLPEFKLKNSVITFVTIGVVIISTGSLIWYVNANAWRSNKILLSALTDVAHANAFAKVGKIGDATLLAKQGLQKFKLAESYNACGTQEVREHFTQRASSLQNKKWMPDDLKKAYFDTAVKFQTIQKKQTPKDPRFPLFLAGLYSSVGDYKNEQKELEIAHNLSLKKQIIILKQGTNALKLGEGNKALEYFKEAYELDKTFPQAIAFYVRSLVQAGKKEEAENIVKEFRGDITPQK